MPHPFRKCWSIPKDSILTLFTWTLLFICICSVQSTSNGDTSKRVLKATSIQMPPFLMVSDKDNKTEMEGIVVDILKACERFMNVSFEIVLVKDNKWGQIDDEGNWTGMIGEVKSGYADIAAAPLTVTPSRILHVDMSHPFLTSGLRILIKRPEFTYLWNNINFVFQPFSPVVWVLIVVSTGVTGAALGIIGHFSPFEWTNTVDVQISREKRESFNWQNSFWYIITTFMWQGYRHFPRSYSGRILSVFWWAFALFTLVLYIGSIAAHLQSSSSRVTELPFNTFHDMARQKEVTYGTLQSSSTLNYFKNSNLAIQRMIYKNMLRFEDNMVLSYAEGLAKVRNSNGSYAFIMEGYMAEYEVSRSPCDLVMIGDDINEIDFSFVTAKGSALSTEINFALFKLKKTGILENIHKKWMLGECASHPYQETIIESGSVSVGSLDAHLIASPLILLLIGIILSGIVLAAEVFLSKEETKRGSLSTEDGHQLRDNFEDGN